MELALPSEAISRATSTASIFPKKTIFRRGRFVDVSFPGQYPVAKRINPVAAQAARKLKQLGFQPHKATLIGESFGNWVNAEIARQLGRVDRIVAMNPASEFGGYTPPDLRPLATTSYSFHTYSVYDSRLRCN